VPGAARYTLALANQREVFLILDTAEPQWDMAETWPRLPLGSLDLLIRAVDERGADASTALAMCQVAITSERYIPWA
jgi:hypothetical protein